MSPCYLQMTKLCCVLEGDGCVVGGYNGSHRFITRGEKKSFFETLRFAQDQTILKGNLC